MPAQAVSQAATVDWNIVAGAIATFITTAIIAWVGRQSGKKKVEAEEKAMPTVMTGAVLQDNYTMLMAAEANRQLAEELRMVRYAVVQLRDELVETKIELERLTKKLSP